MENYSRYYDYRSVDAEYYAGYTIPKYLSSVIPENKTTRILDIGCGYGMLLSALAKLGYSHVAGIDASDKAVQHCTEHGLDVELTDILNYCHSAKQKFDFIVMSHVLEHIPKADIITVLEGIRLHLLNTNGVLCVMVPNAQSNTGSYWAYEDFTHSTLFTSGSIVYVLRAAGFNFIQFLDPHGTQDSSFIKKMFKGALLPLYKFKILFWNKVTSSSYHELSPVIFTYELKVLASESTHAS